MSYGKKKTDRVTDLKTGQGDQTVLDDDTFGSFGVSFTFSVASNKKELNQASRAGADLVYFEAITSILIRMKQGMAMEMGVYSPCGTRSLS